MNDPIRRLRAEARHLTHDKVPTAIRSPAPFRMAALALARPRVKRGTSIARVARALGLPPQSLGRWLRESPRAPALRPVTVALTPAPVPRPTPPPERGAVLITPQGLRVEGLDPDALIAVLRALG